MSHEYLGRDSYGWYLEAAYWAGQTYLWYNAYRDASRALAEANANASSSQAQLEALQAQYNEVVASLAEVQQQYAAADAELTDAKASLAESDAVLLSEQQAHLQTQAQAQQDAIFAQERILDLSTDLEATQEERDQAQMDFEGAQIEVENLQGDLTTSFLDRQQASVDAAIRQGEGLPGTAPFALPDAPGLIPGINELRQPVEPIQPVSPTGFDPDLSFLLGSQINQGQSPQQQPIDQVSPLGIGLDPQNIEGDIPFTPSQGDIFKPSDLHNILRERRGGAVPSAFNK